MRGRGTTPLMGNRESQLPRRLLTMRGAILPLHGAPLEAQEPVERVVQQA